jgi:hypothetical protein
MSLTGSFRGSQGDAPSAVVLRVRAPGLSVAAPMRLLILQPFLSRHLLDGGHLMRLREVRVAL